MIKQLAKNEFLKNVLTLFTGTAFASVIPLVFSVAISRLYTPEQFGVYAIISALLGVFVNVAGGRYEMVIMLPKSDQKSKNLMGLTIITALLSSLVLFLLFSLFKAPIVDLINVSGVEDWLLFIPLMVGLMAMFKPLNFWLSKHKAYKLSSIAKVTQSIGIALTTVLLGWIGYEGGLILGYAIGWVFFVGALWYFHYSTGGDLLKFKFKQMLALAKEYKAFPRLNVPATFINDTAIQLSVFLIGHFYTTEETGYFNFSRQYIYVPMTLIALSVSNVYFQRISETVSNKKPLINEFRRLVIVLAGLSIVGGGIVYFFAEPIFSFVFGEKWTYAGYLSTILIFSYAIKFIVSPLGSVLPALNELKLANIFPALYILLIASLYMFKDIQFESFLKYMVIFEVISYTIYFIIIYYTIIKYDRGISIQKPA